MSESAMQVSRPPAQLVSVLDRMKRIAFKYLRVGAPSYRYNIDPIQLAALIWEAERLRDQIGAIVEIGVARGMTTRFIAEHLVRTGQNDQKIYAIDTFSSFIPRDVDHEINVRGKKLRELRAFAYNDYTSWARNFAEFPCVAPIKADCATFDYSVLGPIKLAFLDVDLYLPTKAALPRIFEQLVEGGVILVDDVLDNATYDGAYQAYMEFCAEQQLRPSLVGRRCGLIRKQSSGP